jgi:curved DNA-binding protein CbpA
MPADFYELLGVDEGATSEELKRAYREQARRYHPDVNDDDRANVQFQVVRRAYEVLSDPKERADYDRLGHESYVRRRMDGFPTSGDAADDRWRVGPTDGRRTAPGRGPVSGERDTAGTPTDDGGSAEGNRRRPREKPSNPSDPDRSGESGGRASAARTNGAGREATQSSGAVGARVGLREAWVATVAATVLYLSGVGQYLLADRAAATALADRLVAAPIATLRGAASADVGLPAPGTVARAAVIDAVAVEPTSAAVFPLGAVVLPFVLGWTVRRFGRGAAWLYVLLACGPAVALLVTAAAPSTVSVPVAVVVGCLLAPALGAGGFLVDVGRALVGRRGRGQEQGRGRERERETR